MIKSNRGQLSIFMGITLIIVMSMLAFIINVGLFVKAKINLQNAADAAAFSGAATQARQLTNIAYANWELRNTYKEWMFKYYVLGQLGLMAAPNNLSDSNIGGNGSVRFDLRNPDINGTNEFDKYNIASICIHNNSKTNICPIYALPGIPRFPAIGVAGISEIHEAFVNKLEEEKGKDCSRRSKANFLTALSWAYGSGLLDIPEAPLVAANRPGAWPQSLELSFRIRNLEMIMNRPPVAEMTRANINQLEDQAREIGLNERPIKAFWSAYRNLGGGAYKDCASTPGVSCTPEELSYSLKLTELPPTPYNATASSVSGFLIPENFVYPGANGGTALQKHYVDLQLMPVNLATMFTTFVDMEKNNSALGVVSGASCGVSKTALPVPGYIVGFNKNPEVLTYYAVKAESKFIGLFFPIGGSDGIKLTAYSAAKPFGGRIGPKLFAYSPDKKTVLARNDENRRSGSYVNGLVVETISAAGFQPGMPIPSRREFWVTNLQNTIGGVPGTSANITYGIPNMIYDFTNEGDLDTQRSSTGSVQEISPLLFKNAITQEILGLYHAPQFRALKASVGTINPGTAMTGKDVIKSIVRARRPTKYDAINYLIPDFREVSDGNNAAPIVQKLQDIEGIGYAYKLFAPLLGPNLLYKTANQIESVVSTYMTANDDAITTYLQSLLAVANNILSSDTRGNSGGAASSIHVNAGTSIDRPSFLAAAPANDPTCKTDLASKFNHFFRAEFVGCGIVPLKKMMVDFIANSAESANGLDKGLYYVGYYYSSDSEGLGLKPEQLMTAYFPGVRQGTAAGDKGTPVNFSNTATETYSTRRNYYSTKFFHMAKVFDSAPGAGNATKGRLDYQEQPALREKATPHTIDGEVVELKNPLKYSDVGNNSYFLDF